MTELDPQSSGWDIDRTISPERQVSLGGHVLRLTYDNTSVYRFKQPFDMLDHAFYRHDGGAGGTYIFDSNELCNDLTDDWYPTQLMPYPSDFDLQAYQNYQAQKMDAELQTFGEES